MLISYTAIYILTITAAKRAAGARALIQKTHNAKIRAYCGIINDVFYLLITDGAADCKIYKIYFKVVEIYA